MVRQPCGNIKIVIAPALSARSDGPNEEAKMRRSQTVHDDNWHVRGCLAGVNVATVWRASITQKRANMLLPDKEN